jgi:outer membrane receptor protein involved in Fe transport
MGRTVCAAVAADPELVLAAAVDPFGVGETIEGVEVDGRWTVSPRWVLHLVGLTSDGRSDGGDPLADVPADRLALGAAFDDGPWRVAARVEHRFAKSDPASGEVPTDAADILSMTARRRWSNGLELGLFGRNLLDETYLPTADDRAVPASGLSVGMELGWKGYTRAPS